MAFSAPLALRGQEKPLSVTGTFSTGYYSTTTRGEADQSVAFVPVGARFDIGGYYLSPDLLGYSVQPELNLGPQASDAGFQGGNGIRLSTTLLRKSITPLTFRYSNIQVEDVFFGSLSQISGYTLKNRTKDLGVTWEFKPHGLPDTTVDWGTGSVFSKSDAGGPSEYESQANHLNVDTNWERWGWDLQGFMRRSRQESDLLQPAQGGTGPGTLSEAVVQYQGSARKSFVGDSELYVNGGSQSMSSLLVDMPFSLNAHYASANLRLRQRRRWKSQLRAGYSSNIASQLLEQAIHSLTGPGAVAPGGNVLAPFSHGMSNLTLSATTSLAVGHGLGIYGSVERSAMYSSSQNSALDSHYLTASGGVTYTRKFSWGNLSGEYARDLGVGSLVGQFGRIQGQHYVASAQHGSSGGLQFDASIHGSAQEVQTVQPLSNKSFSVEGSVADRLVGGLSARVGGGWQWGSIVNTANEFRTNGYTARVGLDHPRVQIGASINSSLSNSLPLYNQVLDGLGLGPILAIDREVVPSDYRAKSFTLHSNPLRKVEISASWTRSSQHLAGFLTNNFDVLNVYATYYFRRIKLDAGFIRSNQVFLAYPATARQRFYIRFARSARLF